MLCFETFPVGPLGCNCVLAWDAESARGVVVDPGGEASRIRERVEGRAFTVEAILLTHAHFDHLGAARELQEAWGVKVHLHPADLYLLDGLDMQTGLYGMPAVARPEVVELAEGMALGGLRVLHTPGHTPGGCCFLGESRNGPVLLSGDTLFQGGVGRTDLWGGHWDALEQGILAKLYTLEDRTLVYPGHGPTTTVGTEAEENPFVRRA